MSRFVRDGAKFRAAGYKFATNGGGGWRPYLFLALTLWRVDGELLGLLDDAFKLTRVWLGSGGRPRPPTPKRNELRGHTRLRIARAL